MATIHKNLSDIDYSKIPNANGWRFGIVVSEWNEEITEGLYKGAFQALKDCGVSESDIERFNVPGSYELIFGAKLIANSRNVDAVICLGSVIRGETAHFDYVCSAAAHGIKDLNIELNTPIIFGVLTDDNIEQSRARSGGKHGNKGAEAAVTAVKMVALQREL